MNYTQIAILSCCVLFVGMVVVAFAGHRLGVRRLRRTGSAEQVGVATVEGAVFALLGLLTAFTFSGAYGRFDARRQLIVREVNAIGTAYLLLDVLPSAAQPSLRALFFDYADARGSFFLKLTDPPAARAELARAAALQAEIWRRVVAATAEAGYEPARLIALPALNAMIDITTTREIAVQTHPPLAIYLMLFALALIGAALTGYGMARSETPSHIHVVAFAIVTAVTFYIILDMDYPRFGLIRLDSDNQLLVDLRKSLEHMGASAPQ